MAHHEFFNKVVQKLLPILFDGASDLEDCHTSRFNRNIVCMAREWVQSQARRLKLKTVD